MNRLIILLLVFLTGGMAFTASAQGIQDFLYLKDPVQQETFLSVGLNRMRVSNPAAPSPENHNLAAFNLYLDLRHYRLEKGQMSLHYANPLVTDLILLLSETIDNPNSILRAEGSSLSSGPIGWLNLGWNLSGPGAAQPLLGFHHNDYFLGSTYVYDSVPGQGRISHEPQGYYFSAGPLLGLRAAAGSFALVELRGLYGLSYWRATSLSYAEENDAYPKPHWLHVQADVLTKWGIFGSIQYHGMLNRGDLPNATRRIDAVLGFQVML